ncbi:crotonase [Sulfurifustis variabilis]|uniref:enoyl-CoA hydratase n=1 Tax=Sulfurifustis variabilis TaxID=1675686 RepID=A0A1C7AG13_9GAMM|nr:3-hydroxyacyl-CoA dehydrogenase NAD-binding domain-containing protein [Sulfurifustis variabilis]BAU50390.1 crotonase [Sulfurifustis variabilis]
MSAEPKAAAAVDASAPAFRHWRIELGAVDSAGRLVAADAERQLALLTLDVEGQSANTLSQEVLREFDVVLSEIAGRPLRGVILRSGKPSGFVVGADVREFEHLSDASQAAGLARLAQEIFNRLEALPYPSVALIHGYCLGGGLELALACRYRIGREDAATRLGLPEVKLGIHPGFAGTVRAPRLIGHLAALDLMLTGRTVSAREARRLGLVDDVVPERHLLQAGQSFLEKRPPPRRPARYNGLLGLGAVRPWVSRLLEKRVRARVNPDHYPAPYRILELWRSNASQEREAESLGELLVGRTSRNLVHVFLLGEALKRAGREHPHDIRRVHVVGAGTMGADIAMWAASKGFVVTLQDQKPEILARAMARASAFCKKRLKDPRQVQETMDRLMPDLAGHGLRRAELVIEAIVEKIEPKQALFRMIEERAPATALFATNTSSIPLEVLAQGLRDPTRLVGLHFFNPVEKMQLVEIVRGEQSAEAALDRARAWTAAIDRLPLDVKSSPGFLVNRILMPYLLEAVILVEEGVAPEEVDRAAVEFGMPMGPIELSDTVGLDICLSVAEMLSGPLHIDVPARLRELVEQGRLGKKSGEGFYRYTGKGRSKHARRGKERRGHVPVTERLILRLLNEAMACLREGVVKDPDAVDAGMVYGTGFAPYLGGPMRYVESLGETGIGHSLYRLSQEYGDRFTPDAGWSRPELRAR